MLTYYPYIFPAIFSRLLSYATNDVWFTFILRCSFQDTIQFCGRTKCWFFTLIVKEIVHASYSAKMDLSRETSLCNYTLAYMSCAIEWRERGPKQLLCKLHISFTLHCFWIFFFYLHIIIVLFVNYYSFTWIMHLLTLQNWLEFFQVIRLDCTPP